MDRIISPARWLYSSGGGEGRAVASYTWHVEVREGRAVASNTWHVEVCCCSVVLEVLNSKRSSSIFLLGVKMNLTCRVETRAVVRDGRAVSQVIAG